MNAGRNQRVTLYRRYKRMLLALDILTQNKIVQASNYAQAKKRIEKLYEEWQEEYRRTRAPSARPRGRPRLEPLVPHGSKCRRTGCDKIVKPGYAYCSKYCAPYAFLSDVGSEDE